ncbi:MAG: tetratricopeptide repeat protein [candidate division Zixibacteria bacterium]|nr:tetratricopeptide repeat protein [candidate division Zixibacteria bacterium]
MIMGRMTASKIIIILLALFWFSSAGNAQTFEEDFRQGIEYYNEGDYIGAIEVFSDLVDRGYRRSELYYNLGCAYFKSGTLGKAILNFNRALELDPSDEDARINLQYARSFTIDKIEELDRSFIWEIYEGIINLLNINTGLIINALILWLFALIVIAIIWFKWRNKFAWYVFSITLLLLITASAISAYRINNEMNTRNGVLIVKQADVRTGPGDDFSLQFTAHEGLEFEIESEREGYWRIQLKNGLKGWVEQDAVGVI